MSDTLDECKGVPPCDKYKAPKTTKLEGKIFISYVYFPSPSNDYNLSYFIENEIKYRENVFYSIVINGHNCAYTIPKLSNVNVIYRDNTGFDFGGYEASINYAFEKWGEYQEFDYFFFMNSGVIGPILKDKTEDWYSKFTTKFTNLVKLVGTTIVCLPQWDAGGFGPKVEGFCFCLDKKGLELVLKDGTIFYNHETKRDAIINGEYALSRCIINNGFTIDCMLEKYKNINWYDGRNHFMNDNNHPSRKNSYFGGSIDPYEVIFHKWFWPGHPYVSLDIIENYTMKKWKG